MNKKIRNISIRVFFACIAVFAFLMLASKIFPIQFNYEIGIKAFLLQYKLKWVIVALTLGAGISAFISFLFGNIRKRINEKTMFFYFPIAVVVLGIWNIAAILLRNMGIFIIDVINDPVELLLVGVIILGIDFLRERFFHKQ